MTEKIKSFLLVLIPFTLVFFAAQHYIVEDLSKSRTFYLSTWSIYTFHFCATLLIYMFVLFVQKTFFDKTGLAFMACSLLKMMAAIVFLLPLILHEEKDALNDVIAFFIPYFLFLLLETVFTVKTLNSN